MAEPSVVIEFKVEGRVQGVGFRYFTLRAAKALQIRGWVRNMPDGSVMVLAAADASRMAAFRERLRVGPPHGWVNQLSETPLPAAAGQGFLDFNITY